MVHDGHWTELFFTPFTLEMSRKLLNFYDVEIEDKRCVVAEVSPKKVGDKDICYITPSSAMVTRNKKRSKTDTNSESADVTVEQGTEEREAVEDAKSRSISSKGGEPSAESA